MWRKAELKLTPALKSISVLPCVLHMHTSNNNLLNVMQHLFHAFLFAYLFFLTDAVITDIIAKIKHIVN